MMIRKGSKMWELCHFSSHEIAPPGSKKHARLTIGLLYKEPKKLTTLPVS
jgi:hypothetical protein